MFGINRRANAKELVLFASLFVLVAANIASAESNADLVNAKVERTIDLTSHLAHVTNLITVENKAASGSFKSYTFAVESSNAKNVAFIGAQVDFLK
jgi:oligosaccharyltransferase complex subunit alpha (ribophorin I)